MKEPQGPQDMECCLPCLAQSSGMFLWSRAARLGCAPGVGVCVAGALSHFTNKDLGLGS